jgi:hypothetical protein
MWVCKGVTLSTICTTADQWQNPKNNIKILKRHLCVNLYANNCEHYDGNSVRAHCVPTNVDLRNLKLK